MKSFSKKYSESEDFAIDIAKAVFKESSIEGYLCFSDIYDSLNCGIFQRHCNFVFNNNKHQTTANMGLLLWKQNGKLVPAVYTLFKAKGRNRTYGLNDTVIYRDWRTLDHKYLQSVPRWTIFNPSAAIE